MHTRLLLCLTLLTACADDKGGPPGGTGGGGSDDGDGGSASAGCGWDEWSIVGELVVDPGTCLAWTADQGSVTWYDAVSPTEATDGGCTDYCDDDPGICHDMGSVEGITDWRVPTMAELTDFALKNPPVSDPTGDLWSIESEDEIAGMAWTVDLTDAGAEFLLEKSGGAHLRCVADAD